MARVDKVGSNCDGFKIVTHDVHGRVSRYRAVQGQQEGHTYDIDGNDDSSPEHEAFMIQTLKQDIIDYLCPTINPCPELDDLLITKETPHGQADEAYRLLVIERHGVDPSQVYDAITKTDFVDMVEQTTGEQVVYEVVDNFEVEVGKSNEASQGGVGDEPDVPNTSTSSPPPSSAGGARDGAAGGTEGQDKPGLPAPSVMPPWWAFLVIPLSVCCLGACCAAALRRCGSSDKPRLGDAATKAEDALCKANTFLATGVTSVGAATNALQRHGSSVGREYSDVSPFWRPSKPSVGTSSDEPIMGSLLGATPSEFEKNAAG